MAINCLTHYQSRVCARRRGCSFRPYIAKGIVFIWEKSLRPEKSNTFSYVRTRMPLSRPRVTSGFSRVYVESTVFPPCVTKIPASRSRGGRPALCRPLEVGHQDVELAPRDRDPLAREQTLKP